MAKLKILGQWFLALWLLAFPTYVSACPGCSAALDATVGRGFNLSIYFMIAMPFLVVALLGFGIFAVLRATRTEQSDRQLTIKSTN